MFIIIGGLLLLLQLTIAIEIQMTFNNAPIPIPDNVLRNAVCEVFHQNDCETTIRKTDGILLKIENVKIVNINTLPDNSFTLLDNYLKHNTSFNPYTPEESGLVQVVEMADLKRDAYLATSLYMLIIIILFLIYVQCVRSSSSS